MKSRNLIRKLLVISLGSLVVWDGLVHQAVAEEEGSSGTSSGSVLTPRGRPFRSQAAAERNGGININTPANRAEDGMVLDVVSRPALTIPDLATVSNVIEVAAIGGAPLRVKKLTVSMDIQHTFTGDLLITLAHGGRDVALFSQRGGGNDGLDITLDDAATIPIGSAPFTSSGGFGTIFRGTFRPEAPLSVFASTSPSGGIAVVAESTSAINASTIQGPWILTIQDRLGIDFGVLNSWTLHIETFNALSGGKLPRSLSETHFGATNLIFRADIEPH